LADLNLIASNIKSTLEQVTELKEVFDHEPQKLTQLPAATLFFDGFSQTDGSTRSNEVGWRWVIRIYVPINTSDVKKPQDDIMNLIQKVIKQLRENISLGGSCLYHTVSSGEIFVLLEQKPQMVAELQLVATTQEYF
jgi:hypothetical protein